MAVNRALAELDFAPGELSENQYRVQILVAPEEGFLGVGGTDALVEVSLVGTGPDGLPLRDDLEEDEEYEDEEAEFLQPEAGSARLRDLLEHVLAGLDIEAKVHIVETAEALTAELTGDDLGVFIGKRGQTIDAVEYLASIILYPRPDVRKRVEIDAEGYKGRRQKTLERLALRRAQEAFKRGRPVELEPMTPAERKIVHMTLKDRRDVTTESTGREPNRAIVITPVGRGGRPPERSR